MSDRPIPKEEIDWNNVIDIAKKHVESVDDGTYHEDNDDAAYMFREVLMAIYSRDYFDWENGKTP